MALQLLNVDQRAQVKGSSTFRNYLQEKIIGTAGYGCAYYLGLTSFDVQQAKRRMVSAKIQEDVAFLANDSNLVHMMFTKMITRALDKYDDAGSFSTTEELVNNVIDNLNTGTNFEYLVSDYFDEKTALEQFKF